jgi:hypothetical protein
MKVKELFETRERNVLNVKGRQDKTYNGIFTCANLRMTSLKGSPESTKGYYCFNNELTSLDGISSVIHGNLMAYTNKLTSLQGIHKQIKYISGAADFEDNPIKSHVLGLLKIDGLRGVWLSNKKLQFVLNKHLTNGRDIFACQEELIEEGLEAFAKL